jgi:hypothetical protein
MDVTNLADKAKKYALEVGADALVIKALDGIPKFFKLVKDAHDSLPPAYQQKIPSLLGLSTKDEEVFNSLVSQLESKDQLAIMNFLGKCKKHERRRFILLVAGMEFIPAKAEEKTVTTKSEKKDGKKETIENIKAGSPAIDFRMIFLTAFAKIIRIEFGDDYDKAYDFCVNGRMIIPDTLYQKVLEAFSAGKKKTDEIVKEGNKKVSKVLAKGAAETGKIIEEVAILAKKERKTFSENFRLLEQASIDFRDAKKKGGKK